MLKDHDDHNSAASPPSHSPCRVALVLAACGDPSAEETGGGQERADREDRPPSGQQWSKWPRNPRWRIRDRQSRTPLKLVEYGSHTCSHCAEFSEEGDGPDGREVRRLGGGQLRNPQPHPRPDRPHHRHARALQQSQAFHPLADQAWANIEPIFGQREHEPGRLCTTAMQQAGASALRRRDPGRRAGSTSSPRAG